MGRNGYGGKSHTNKKTVSAKPSRKRKRKTTKTTFRGGKVL